MHEHQKPTSTLTSMDICIYTPNHRRGVRASFCLFLEKTIISGSSSFLFHKNCTAFWQVALAHFHRCELDYVLLHCFLDIIASPPNCALGFGLQLRPIFLAFENDGDIMMAGSVRHEGRLDSSAPEGVLTDNKKLTECHKVVFRDDQVTVHVDAGRRCLFCVFPTHPPVSV